MMTSDKQNPSSPDTIVVDGKTYRVFGPNTPAVLRNVLDNLPEPMGLVDSDGAEVNQVVPYIGLENMVEILSACCDELIVLGDQIEDTLAEKLRNIELVLRLYVDNDYDLASFRNELEKLLSQP